jgi:hypothetical protein
MIPLHICSMCIKTNQVGKQEVGIWWVQKHFPWYGVPIWSLWPNIRFLPSIVAQKNVDLVGFYTHWTYMLIFRRIFLSNYRWQKSDIRSRASYRYAILWVPFLDPSDSYFLFADLVGFYTHWTYMHIFLSNYWWQYPQYSIPIWSLWPNIRFLPSIVAEKNTGSYFINPHTQIL